MRWRFDALGRLLLKGVNDPDFITKLYRVDNAKGVPANWQCDLKDTGANSLERLGYVPLPSSAAIVNAVRQMLCASAGNLSNSFKAALIHEMGRVFLEIGILPALLPMLSDMTTAVNARLAAQAVALRAWNEWIPFSRRVSEGLITPGSRILRSAKAPPVRPAALRTLGSSSPRFQKWDLGDNRF
jgi:hypothetical protein